MDYDQLYKECQSEFPTFNMRKKRDSLLMKNIDKALKILTFGKMKSFLTSYITTIGTTVWVTDNWETYHANVKYEILSHEMVHMRQARTLGLVLYSILYLFIPIPFGFAWFRAKFEMQAYEESMRVVYRAHGIDSLTNPLYKARIVGHFTGPDYGWMMPFKSTVEKWYDGVVDKIRNGE